MRRPPSRRVLAATLLALSALGAGTAIRAGSSRAASPGLIVFASDRDKANPGEIYSLAPGTAARDVSRSLAADYGLAVAPVGDTIAFWSARSGIDRVYLSRSDGSHLRLVRRQGPGLSGLNAGGGVLEFSADGSRLFASYSAFHGARETSYAFAVETRTAAARPLHGCYGARPSPDGALEACPGPRSTSVYDLAGHRRFTLRGTNPLWSSRGLLTSTPAAGNTGSAPAHIVDASGATRGIVEGVPIAWSPDGERLLLARHDSSLLVADAQGSAGARLLLRKWAPGQASFTPDGRFVVALDRTGKQLLLPVTGGPAVATLGFGDAAWSRDGRMAYVGRASSPARPGVTLPVFVAGERGQHPQLVGRFPFDDHGYATLRWRPDGKRVLFLTSTSCGGKGLYTVPASGGAAHPLTHDPRDLEAPAWSRDGARIAYTAQQFACHLRAGEPIHIATMAADGSHPQRVTDENSTNGSFDGEPSFSPDGGSIAFWAGTFDSATLQTIALAGGTRTTLVPREGAATAPAWSPDGSRIAYVSAGAAIMAIAPGGGPAQLIAALPARKSCSAAGLAWSPDGTQLAVPEDGGIDIVTVGPSATARLVIRVPCAENPSFSPDGSQIAFDAPLEHGLGRQTAIMVANADGSGVRTLSTVPFRQSVHPAWQPSP